MDGTEAPPRDCASADVRNNAGQTALFKVCARVKLEVCSNTTHFCAPHVLKACFNENVSLVGALLEHGASVWVTDNKSQSCLHAYAATGADQPGIALLLIRAAESGDAFAQHENPAAVFVNGLDADGNTAMHLATSRKGVKTLLENGADLTVRMSERWRSRRGEMC
jgi:hypothetical protein